MLPYFEAPVLHLGPVSISLFGLIVGFAIYVAFSIASKRFQRFGLSVAIGERMGFWMLGGSIIGAHLFSALLYFPDQVAQDPWLLLQFWKDISSFGGIIGGLATATVFLWWNLKGDAARFRWMYLDIVAYLMPIGFGIGRLGCALVHDHPGTITNFPLAISLKTAAARDFIIDMYASAGLAGSLPADSVLAHMGFHDLGVYEFLYLSLVVTPVMVWLNKRDRVPGFNLLVFGVMYLPVRFAFDFLRLIDIRYAGLTPGQWTAMIAMLALPLVWLSMRSRLRFQTVVAEQFSEQTNEISVA
ncbi:MAG: prolipoprotein diacylglyceryl transferase family protein [Gemmatimonadaceae bacterium]